MTFPTHPEYFSPKEWKAQLEIEADACARRHSLDPSDVREIFYKLDADKWHSPNFPFYTEFDRAIQIIGVENALSLFKLCPMSELSIKVFIYDYVFASAFEPIYTFDELADLIEKCVSFQYTHKDNIINTGFPHNCFMDSLWLDTYLSRLYYVKLPINFPDLSIKTGKSSLIEQFSEKFNFDDSEYYSIWAKPLDFLAEIAHNHQWVFDLINCQLRDGTFYCSNDETVAKICSYDESPHMSFLHVDMASKLEKMRVSLFRTRIGILNRLEHALRKQDAEELWNDCCKIIADEILAPDVEGLLYMDNILNFSETSISFDHLYRTVRINHHNSGLLDIVSVIAHVEKELSLHVLNDLKIRMQKTESEIGQISSYYEAYEKPWAKNLDDIIWWYFLERQSEKESNFFTEFYRKVNESFESELFDEVITRQKVKRKFMPKFQAKQEKFGEILKNFTELTGRFPDNLEIILPRAEKHLTPEQERARKKHEYKCRDEIHILGTVPMKRSNDVLVNKHCISLGDSLFKILLRLIQELLSNPDGWINRLTLFEEGIVSDPYAPQPYSNLRTIIEGSLDKRDGCLFIENDGSKRYRISTHPEFITYDKEKLLNHVLPEIRKVAENLPD